MESGQSIATRIAAGAALFWAGLRIVVMAFAAAAGAGIMVMIFVTCFDVLSRAFGGSLHGAYDIVRVAGAVTIACALPYTTAVKGHVAVEYFFHKLGGRGRLVVDTICRLVTMALFGTLAWQFAAYGSTLRRTGDISLTLGIPLYWVAYLTALSFLVTLLVTLHNLLHPGHEMIKP